MRFCCWKQTGAFEKDIRSFAFKDCKPSSNLSHGPAIPALHPTQYTRRPANEVVVQAGYYRVQTKQGFSWKNTTEEYKCELSKPQVWPVCVLRIRT
ncbi:hypothetical protein O181_027633 [Austropuccinia psidii MF-1]|uniref:Uncharacterized protein n=1 Tax=Austropuccinia psidii MF-1 TaxID=1389203 RepID=A0A9Q3CS67_9BASI|nr:hypothetical protein [Austropuccinia psidii MF-1]